jgi:hypothetical protein
MGGKRRWNVQNRMWLIEYERPGSRLTVDCTRFVMKCG